MRKYIITALRYLHGAFIVAGILPLFTAILALFGQDETRVFLTSLIVLVPYVVISIAGAKCRTMYTFILFSVASIVLTVVVAPTLPEKIVYPFLGVLILIIRTSGRLNEKEDILTTPHPAAAVLFALLYLVSFGIDDELLRTVNYYLAFAYVILVLVFMNLNSLETYLNVNRDVANIPHRQISRTNSVILSVFVGLTALVMIFLPRSGLDNVIMAILRGAREVLKQLIGLLQRKGPEVEPTTLPPEETLAPDPGSMPLPDATTPAWLQILYQALTYVIAISVGVTLVYLLVRGIIGVIRRFYRPIKENDDVQEFIDRSTEERSYASAINERTRIFDFSDEAQVRRYYRKLIEGRAKGKLRASYAPTELEDAANLPEGEARERLHELYEKTRYSKEGAVEGDAREIRRLRF